MIRKPKEWLEIVALALITVVLSVVILDQLAAILQPLFIAIFLCYIAFPLHRALLRLKIPSMLAKFLVPIFFLLLLGGMALITTLSFRKLADQFPLYRQQMEIMVYQTIAWVEGLHPLLQGFLRGFSIPFDAIGKYLTRGVGSFFSSVGMAFVVLFYTIFIILELRSFPKRFVRAYGSSFWRDIQNLMGSISEKIMTYVRVKTLVSLFATIPCGIILLFFGVDLWLFWTLLIFLGNFIPYVGSLIAFLFPILLLFLESGNPFHAGMLAILLVAIKNLVEAFVEPRLAGKILNLSPLLVILTVTFWAWLWGITGMILSVPILVVVKTTLEAIPSTKSLADLMGEGT